ncbi:MAG: peptidase dimerization domain-containing protein [Caldilineaceae bacterium]
MQDRFTKWLLFAPLGLTLIGLGVSVTTDATLRKGRASPGSGVARWGCASSTPVSPSSVTPSKSGRCWIGSRNEATHTRRACILACSPRADSQCGPGVRGATRGEVGEGRIAAALAEWFGALGGEVHVHEALPGRPNVYGLWRGIRTPAGCGRTYRHRGRGTHDRGSVFRSKRTRTPTVVARWTPGVAGRDPGAAGSDADAGRDAARFSAHRRHRGRGSGATGAPTFLPTGCANRRHVDQLLVAEPTLCRPIHGHKGVVRQRFEVRGQAAHSSQPHLGRNAITAAA